MEVKMEDPAKFFEIIMLVCFGAAWPLSILKLYRTKKAHGKSLMFLGVIMGGYLAGILFKIYGRLDAVIILYAFNLIMVAVDFSLCCRYRGNI